MSEIMRRKIARVLAEAVATLDPADRAERAKRPGISAHIEGELVRFVWASKDLALVERAWLIDDDNLEFPEPQFLAEAPDTVPDEWVTP